MGAIEGTVQQQKTERHSISVAGGCIQLSVSQQVTCGCDGKVQSAVASVESCSVEKICMPDEIKEVRAMIERHVQHTASGRTRQILDLWDEMVPKFVKVLPKDYKRVLQAIERVKSAGLSGEEAIMAAFEENARDLSRVGGN